LGLQAQQSEDGTLANDLLSLMQANKVDYTIFFRSLGEFNLGQDANNELLRDFFLDRESFDQWAIRYKERLKVEESRDEERKVRMNRTNPKFVLRNYLAQNAIDAAQKNRDYSEINRLLGILQHPFEEHPGMESYAAAPPNWGKHIMVSCSS
jgi:uncharacterized protein YdiU (UPF0061 family)